MTYTFKPGDPCWVELFTSDPDRAIAFYGELLGWTAERSGPEYGGYIIFSKDGNAVAGGMHNDGSSGGPDQWTVYLASVDAEWFELHTPAYDDALRFYREVFGWQDPFIVADTPGFRYTTIHSTTPMLGGVMDSAAFLPAGSPGGWRPYFGAEDVDAAVKTLVSLGGSVEREPENTPYGRLASVVDPGGVPFSLGGSNS